ncbi:unnamed protein product [Callosobruchus maculatus]|uniref:Uncharacterized protein n=1 Tax=Callosobruchus maculatus TaxID=64391 RepID=A0A653DAC7_CALMS|nr:unnamed protein product [Callosobruchus maculatus]
MLIWAGLANKMLDLDGDFWDRIRSIKCTFGKEATNVSCSSMDDNNGLWRIYRIPSYHILIIVLEIVVAGIYLPHMDIH